MNDFLNTLERVFGSRVLAAALLIVGIYYGVHGLLSLFSAVRDMTNTQSRLSSLKSHYEMLKLMYEAEAVKQEKGLASFPIETILANNFQELIDHKAKPNPLTQTRLILEEHLNHLVLKYRPTGYALLSIAHIVFRAWGFGFIVFFAYMSAFGNGSDYERTNWDNAFIMSLMVLLGFYLSNIIIHSCVKANIQDRVGYWSYVAGFIVTSCLYLSGFRA